MKKLIYSVIALVLAVPLWVAARESTEAPRGANDPFESTSAQVSTPLTVSSPAASLGMETELEHGVLITKPHGGDDSQNSSGSSSSGPSADEDADKEDVDNSGPGSASSGREDRKDESSNSGPGSLNSDRDENDADEGMEIELEHGVLITKPHGGDDSQNSSGSSSSGPSADEDADKEDVDNSGPGSASSGRDGNDADDNDVDEGLEVEIEHGVTVVKPHGGDEN